MREIEFVIPGQIDSLTGGYIYDRNIVQGLSRLGWPTNVVSLDTSFPTPTAQALRAAANAFDAIADGRIVIIDGLALGGLAEILAAHADRLDLVALVHHPVAFEIGLYAARAKSLHQSEQASLAKVKQVICTSAWTSRALAEYNVSPDLIQIIEPGTSPAPASTGAQGADLNVLCVATVTQRKGHAVLLDALDQLRKKRWQLHCVGSLERDHECAAALQRQIKILGLEQRVNLHGELPDEERDALYAQADIFVLASNLEGYGMALAEAVARGIPIVATECGAIPETVPDGVGILVPAGDCGALAGALDQLISSGATRARLREHALTARDHLPTWEKACARFASTLQKLDAT